MRCKSTLSAFILSVIKVFIILFTIFNIFDLFGLFDASTRSTINNTKIFLPFTIAIIQAFRFTKKEFSFRLIEGVDSSVIKNIIANAGYKIVEEQNNRIIFFHNGLYSSYGEFIVKIEGKNVYITGARGHNRKILAIFLQQRIVTVI